MVQQGDYGNFSLHQNFTYLRSGWILGTAVYLVTGLAGVVTQSHISSALVLPLRDTGPS